MTQSWRAILILGLMSIAVAACSGYARRNNEGNNLIKEQDPNRALEAYQNAQVIEPGRGRSVLQRGDRVL